MKVCKMCGTFSSGETTKCPKCKSYLLEDIKGKICPNCGKENPPNTWICEQCKHFMSEDKTATSNPNVDPRLKAIYDKLLIQRETLSNIYANNLEKEKKTFPVPSDLLNNTYIADEKTATPKDDFSNNISNNAQYVAHAGTVYINTAPQGSDEKNGAGAKNNVFTNEASFRDDKTTKIAGINASNVITSSQGVKTAKKKISFGEIILWILMLATICGMAVSMIFTYTMGDKSLKGYDLVSGLIIQFKLTSIFPKITDTFTATGVALAGFKLILFKMIPYIILTFMALVLINFICQLFMIRVRTKVKAFAIFRLSLTLIALVLFAGIDFYLFGYKHLPLGLIIAGGCNVFAFFLLCFYKKKKRVK